MAVGSAAGGAHDGDDLFDLRRVGRVAQTLVARRVTGIEPRQRRRRPPSTGTNEQNPGHDPSSDSRNEPDYRPNSDRTDYRFRHRAAVNADPRSLSELPQGNSGAVSRDHVSFAEFVVAPSAHDSDANVVLDLVGELVAR